MEARLVYADVLGYSAGVLTAFSMLPQVIKNWKEQSAKDISLLRSISWLIGVGLWIAYGLLIASIPLILINVVNCILGSMSLYLKVKY